MIEGMTTPQSAIDNWPAHVAAQHPTQVVRLVVTTEMVAMLSDWSEPVQVRVRQDRDSPTGWEMDVRRVNLQDAGPWR